MRCILLSIDRVNVPGPFFTALTPGSAPAKLPAVLKVSARLPDPSRIVPFITGVPSSISRLLPVPRSMVPLVTEPFFNVTVSSPAPELIAMPGELTPFTIFVAVILPSLMIVSLPAPVPMPIAEAVTEAVQLHDAKLMLAVPVTVTLIVPLLTMVLLPEPAWMP